LPRKYIEEASMEVESSYELARFLEVETLVDYTELIMTSNLGKKESHKSPLCYRHRTDCSERDEADWVCLLLTS
jgi:succinate dehydrogenase/fumarate reductase flavoprotein subunit